jgi:hypothetical protein
MRSSVTWSVRSFVEPNAESEGGGRHNRLIRVVRSLGARPMVGARRTWCRPALVPRRHALHSLRPDVTLGQTGKLLNPTGSSPARRAHGRGKRHGRPISGR